MNLKETGSIAKANILGMEYSIAITSSLEGTNADGEVNYFLKSILLRPAKSMGGIDATEDEGVHRAKEVLRHEVIHALFYESGLNDRYGSDETLVSFLAAQFPKLCDIFGDLWCMV